MSQLCSFSTRTIPVQGRLQVWEDRLRSAFGDVRATLASEAEFDAWSETLSDSGVLVGRVGTCGHELQLGTNRGCAVRDDLVHVIFLITGRLYVEQSGRRAVLERGDWGFVVVNEAFRHLHVTPVEVLVVDAPRHALFCDPGMERFSAKRFSSEHGSALLAKSYLETLLSQRASLHAMTTSQLIATAVRLVRLSLMEKLGARRAISMQQLLTVRIRDFIDRNLHNPELSVDMLAEAHHCSKRYIHKTFSVGGETLGHYILRARLERCREDLERPALAHLPITQIAFSWGFENAGHFSRAFRRQFGMRPRDCRESALAAVEILEVGAASLGT